MINFGTVRPGTTLRIPFDSFGADGESITLTGLAAADIEIYKDGSTTQRASDVGYTLDDTDGIDIDLITGIHGFSIDLADNTTAGFYAAGSQYRVVVSSVTINAQPVSFTAAIFTIGYPQAVLNTTIATLASQTSFTLTAGPAEDDALNGMEVLIHDVASAVQLGRAVIADYTGSTKTVTLAAATTFTVAASDNIAIMGPAPVMPLVAGRGLAVDATGIVDANVEEWNATSVPAEHTAGYPIVTVKDGTGTGELDTTSGKVSPADGSISSTTFVGGTLLDAAGIRAALGLAAANLDTQISGVPTAVWGAGTRQLTGTQTFNLTGSITGSLSGSVGSVTGAVGSVTGAVGSVTGGVGGNVAGSVGSVTGLTTATIAAAVWGYTLEGAMTAIQWARIVLAALAGKSSGHSTSAPAYRDLADTKNRIAATTDADGRTSVTLDGS